MCFVVVSAEVFVKFCDKLEQNHPAFFERERGRGGKGKLFFPPARRVAEKLALPSSFHYAATSRFAGARTIYISKSTAFLEKGSGVWGEGKNLFSREKKFFPSSQERIHFNRIARCNCYHRHSGGNFAARPQLRP